MIKATRLASAGLMAGAASGHPQSVATPLPPATDQALVTALIAAEDSPDSTIGPTRDPRRTLPCAPPLERRGGIRGMLLLSQKSEARAAGVIPREVTDRLVAMLTEKPVVAYSTAERATLAAILVGAVALSEVQMRAIFVQPDPSVREQVVAAMARASDTDLVRSIAERAVRDPAAIVRFRSISVYARRLRTSDGCSPLIQLARDRDTTIALAAVDALSGGRSDPP